MLRLVLTLAVFVPAFALLGALAGLNRGHEWTGLVAGAVLGGVFGVIYGKGGGPIVDLLFGKEKEEEEDDKETP